MGIKNRLYYKAKNLVQTEDLKSAMERNGLQADNSLNLEIIETLESVKNFHSKSTVLLDVGAHKGLFSKAANAFIDFEKTICFEPNPDMNADLKTNTGGFKTQIENIALSNEEGEVVFHLHEDSTMNSLVDANEEILKEEFPWDNPDKMKEIKVRTTTLDNFISTNNLQSKKFFIKLDTQGNELEVLSKGIETLKNTEIVLLEYMFFSPYETKFTFYELIDFMKAAGFRCEGALTISKRPSKKVSAVDFLFVKDQ